jgi:hypothetical protein
MTFLLLGASCGPSGLAALATCSAGGIEEASDCFCMFDGFSATSRLRLPRLFLINTSPPRFFASTIPPSTL